ncbi:MAG: mechanosensitive ion channel protein MscS [Rhizobiaceae bacterium MnEN-MB40S]|nr:MAG: mechanosensitive ion channel protein MscS [Rhizobiaceae bacterium MnEN-MB40S]
MFQRCLVGNRSRWLNAQWLRAAFLVLAICLASTHVLAQTTSDPDTQDAAPATQQPAELDPVYATWDATAQKAEEVLQEGDADIQTLEQLRETLAKQRDAAFERTQVGSVNVRALQAQLDALGPAPAEGEEETAEVAAERSRLREAIAAANRPILAAQQSFTRAELLIREIDSQIRAQQTRQLLTLYPSPLLVQNWAPAFEELGEHFSRIGAQFGDVMDDPDYARGMRDSLPLILFLGLLALLLLTLSERLVARRLERIAGRVSGRRRRALIVLANLSRLVLPLGATLLFVAVLGVLGIELDSASNLPALVFIIGVFLIIAHWIGHTLFAPTSPDLRILSLDDGQAWQGLRMAQGLGVVLCIDFVLKHLENEFGFTPPTKSVLSTPIVIVGSLLLWRFASLLRIGGEEKAQAETDDESETRLSSGFLGFVARLVQVSAVLSVICVLIGYVDLARFAMEPVIETLGLLGFGLIVYTLLFNLIEDLIGRQEEEEDQLSLIPIGLIILISAGLLPLLALVWGARPTDIAEAWRYLTVGAQIGDTRISINVILTLLVVFSIGVLITRWLQRVLRVSVLPRANMDQGARTALVTVVGYAGLTIAALIAVSMAGINLTSLAFIAGALSLGIGFGLQTIVGNFVSGIILLAERPIKEGDWIEVGGNMGLVKKISVRSTRIETFDRHDVIIPNQDLIAGTVKNMTHSSRIGRLVVPVGVAYGSDVEKVRDVLMAQANANEYALSVPEPQVLFMGLGDSSLDFEIRCFLREIFTIPHAQSQLLIDVYKALGQAGIEIPFPQRDIHLRDIDRLVEAMEKRPERAPGLSASEAPKPDND